MNLNGRREKRRKADESGEMRNIRRSNNEPATLHRRRGCRDADFTDDSDGISAAMMTFAL